MAFISITTVFADEPAGDLLASKLDTEINTIFNVINGNLDNANVPALDTKLGDAPVDGSTYGRKDAAWAIVPGGGGGGGFNKFEIFLTSGTWVQPAGVTVVEIEVFGAGGGGAGGDTASPFSGGGGGGGGGYVYGIDEGVTGNIAVTVGAKGAGGAPNGSGNAGTQSEVLGGGITTKTAGGGGAGIHASTGGGGGSAVGAAGDNKLPGQAGAGVAAITETGGGSTFFIPGAGGSAFKSSGAPITNASGSKNAVLLGGGGAGMQGIAGGGSAGDGADGLVIIRWSE